MKKKKENSICTKLISPSLGCLSICELSRYTGYSPGTQTITYTVLEESRFSKHPVHSFPRGSLRQGAFPHTSLHRREMGIKSENRSKTSTKNFNNSDNSKYQSSDNCAPQVAQQVKNLPSMQEMQETWVQSLGQEDPLEKGMAPHASILAWRTPWTEEPGRLQFIGLQRVEHD